VIGTTPSGVGFLFGVRALISGLVMLPIGRLADRKGKRIFLFLGLLTGGISYIGIAASGSFFTLFLFSFTLALAFAMFMPAGMALLSESVRPSQQGLAMGIYGLCEDMGMVVGPAIGGFLWSAIGPQATFYAAASFSGMGILLYAIENRAIKTRWGSASNRQ
jgi:MFS family permease